MLENIPWVQMVLLWRRTCHVYYDWLHSSNNQTLLNDSRKEGASKAFEKVICIQWLWKEACWVSTQQCWHTLPKTSKVLMLEIWVIWPCLRLSYAFSQQYHFIEECTHKYSDDRCLVSVINLWTQYLKLTSIVCSKCFHLSRKKIMYFGQNISQHYQCVWLGVNQKYPSVSYESSTMVTKYLFAIIASTP